MTAAEVAEPPQSTAKDLIAGTIAGWAQVIAGQPFDNVKSSSVYKGPLDCVKRIVVEEGPLTFYAGSTAPLLGIGACVALQFAFLEAAKRQFAVGNAAAGRKEFSSAQLYASGAIAGLGNSFASGPVEHIRIRLQAQSTANPIYRGTLDAVRKIYGSDGLRGLFHGQAVTVLREVHGYGIYFWSYETLVQRYALRHGGDRKALPATAAAGYGALSGIVLWTAIYPIDVVKSKLQTDALPSQAASRKYSGALDCARKVWAAEGAAGFTKGLTPTMIRCAPSEMRILTARCAPIANASVFVAYELARKQLG